MVLLVRLLVASYLLLGMRCSAWPVPYDMTSDTMPNLELSLSPPSQPAPQVAAVVRDLDSARERFEAVHMDELQMIVKQEVERVRARAADIVGRAMRTFADSAPVKLQSDGNFVGHKRVASSFLAAGAGPSSTDHVVVKVTAVPAATPDAALRKEVDAIGERQMDALRRMFEQASANLKGLTDVLLNEYHDEVQKHFDLLLSHHVPNSLRGNRQEDLLLNLAGFVESGQLRNAVGAPPGQANVQVVASSSSSSLSSSLQNMAARAGVAEHLGRRKLLALEMQLLEAAHRVMKATLQAAVGRLVEARRAIS